MNVAALNVILGLTVSRSEWSKGQAYIEHFRRVAMGVGAILGGRVIGKALIGFNAGIEQAKNQIAAMLAFARKTSITDQLTDANHLYDKLREKAASLPGQTKDYVNMLGKIAEPMARANFDLAQMSDFTANAFVIAEGIGEGWAKSSRDIREFIKYGKMTNQDQFLLTVLGSAGYKTDTESRKGYKKKTAVERGQMLQTAINTPTVRSIGERFGKSWKGQVEQVKDTIELTLGKMGEVVFEKLKKRLDQLSTWFKANKEAVNAWAKSVGEGIGSAFDAAEAAIMWLVEHGDVVKSVIAGIGLMFGFMAGRALLAWAAAMWPFMAASGIIYLFIKLRDAIGSVKAAIVTLGVAFAAVWAFSKLKAYIGGVLDLRREMIRLQAVAAAGQLTANAQSVLNHGFSPNQMALQQAKAGAASVGRGIMGAGAAIAGALPMVGIAFMAAGVIGALTDALNGDSTISGDTIIDVLTGKLSKSEFMKLAHRDLQLSAQASSLAPQMRIAEITRKQDEKAANLAQFKQQNEVKINITTPNPEESAKAIEKMMRERDAEARQAHRALTGNRGEE